MRQRFWTSISRAGVAAMALGVILSGGDNSGVIFAQAQPTTQKPKKTIEPVFRVPKLKNETPATVQAQSVGAESFESEDRAGPNMDRVADSRNLPGVAMNLPKTIPAALPNAPADLPNATITPPPATPVKAVSATSTTKVPHPLDRAVDFAETALKNMRADVRDYTAILSKRERIDGVVGPPGFMNLKVRCPRTLANGKKTPFSIYMKFLRPKDAAGREVVWVEGKNDNRLIAHEGSGFLRLKKFYLDPTGVLAMRGQRYPIYDAGLENLIIKLIEKADRDRAAGPCKVTYREGGEINKRSCSIIELVHEHKRAPYEFHKAQVFIDDELQLPVRFAAYDWPATPGGAPQLLEEYTYYNLKINVGLTDLDFSPENPSYRYPKR